ncbi:MAG: precorrin-6A reductase [Blautia sp.]|nr:precorrin-6A reductase [Blautia sp.]
MKILIFGGTTEGRLLAQKLTDRGHEIAVSTATPLGAEELKNINCHVTTGRLGEAEIEDLVKEYGCVIDATHPYAREITANLETVCGRTGTLLYRVMRESSDDLTDTCIIVGSSREAAEFLKEKPGNIMIASGSGELDCFADIPSERLYPRVLPTHEAITKCEKLGIPHRNILALQGPFSVELNEALLRQYKIRYMVTKDGGKNGGFAEKKEAALRTGTEVILIRRPADYGMPMEKVLELFG